MAVIGGPGQRRTLGGLVALPVGRSFEDQGVRVPVSRSTADWASIGSVVMVSHSAGSRLLVTMVARLGVPFDDEFVEVGGGGGVERP